MHRIIVVTVLSISDVIYAVIHCLEHREPQIAIPSHVAGALCGILLGFIFYESHRHENREGNLLFKVLKWTSMAFLLCYVAIVVSINVIVQWSNDWNHDELGACQINLKSNKFFELNLIEIFQFHKFQKKYSQTFDVN